MSIEVIYVHNMFVSVAELSKLRIWIATVGISQVIGSLTLDGVVLFQPISKNLGPGTE